MNVGLSETVLTLCFRGKAPLAIDRPGTRNIIGVSIGNRSYTEILTGSTQAWGRRLQSAPFLVPIEGKIDIDLEADLRKHEDMILFFAASFAKDWCDRHREKPTLPELLQKLETDFHADLGHGPLMEAIETVYKKCDVDMSRCVQGAVTLETVTFGTTLSAFSALVQRELGKSGVSQTALRARVKSVLESKNHGIGSRMLVCDDCSRIFRNRKTEHSLMETLSARSAQNKPNSRCCVKNSICSVRFARNVICGIKAPLDG